MMTLDWQSIRAKNDKFPDLVRDRRGQIWRYTVSYRRPLVRYYEGDKARCVAYDCRLY
jgi:hypothetical protein